MSPEPTPAILLPGLDRLPAIETERLRLRGIEESDVADLFALFADPAVMRFWSRLPLEREEEARELIELIQMGFEHRELYQWGITVQGEDRIVGTVTLARLDPANRRAELGYALRGDHWGRGLMREALGALLDFAFDRLGLHRLEADADPRNARSIRLLEHLGFTREGLMRERWLVGGEVQDSAVFGLLAREWATRPSG